MTLATLVAITLIHAATKQECTFDTEAQAVDFLKSVDDPDSWNEKPAEADDEVQVQTATAADNTANVHIKADNLTDAAATLDELVKPVADLEPTGHLTTADAAAGDPLGQRTVGVDLGNGTDQTAINGVIQPAAE